MQILKRPEKETYTTESQTNADEENTAFYTSVIRFNKGTIPKVEDEKAYCRCLDFSKAYMQYHIALHISLRYIFCRFKQKKQCIESRGLLFLIKTRPPSPQHNHKLWNQIQRYIKSQLQQPYTSCVLVISFLT